MAEPKVRFKRDDGSVYPPIEPKLLNEYLSVNPDRNKVRKYDKTDVLSVSGDFGVVNQIEFQGRSFAGADLKDYHILYHGDIVYTKSPLKENPFGIVKFNDGPTGIVSTLYAVYHCNDNVDGRIIEYYFDLKSRLNNYLKPLVNIGAKHDMKISAEKAISDYVMFPSLEEQKKIADFLSNVDEVIAACTEKVANLETQKKAVMKKIFSQEVRFKKDDGADFPAWEEVTVGDVTAFHKQGYYTNEEYISDGCKIARVSDLFSPLVVYDDMPMVPMTEKDYEAFKIETGDFLIARSGSIGRYGIVYDIPKSSRVVFGSFVIKFQFDTQKITNEYFGQYYSSSFAEKSLKTITQTGANVNINAENIKSMKMLLPCLEEQRLIADFLSDFDEAIAAAKKELELWKELKKGLLQQMFV